jgi:hypothetical protein
VLRSSTKSEGAEHKNPLDFAFSLCKEAKKQKSKIQKERMICNSKYLRLLLFTLLRSSQSEASTPIKIFAFFHSSFAASAKPTRARRSEGAMRRSEVPVDDCKCKENVYSSKLKHSKPTFIAKANINQKNFSKAKKQRNTKNYF